MVNAAGRPIDAPAESAPAVEPLQDPDQPDRVDVVDRRGIGVVAEAGRVAGQGDDVAHTDRVRPQQLRLQPHQRAIAGGEVQDRLHPGAVLDEIAHGQGAHPHAGHRRVGDVDEIDTRFLQQAGPVERLGRIEPLRRIDLDADHELAPIQLLPQAGRSLGRDQIELRRGQDAGATAGTRRRESGLARSIHRPRSAIQASRASRIAAVCSGVVPQQPPMMRTPASAARRANPAKYSGDEG